MRKAKVGEFHVEQVVGDEHVAGLDVVVDDIPVVHNGDADAHFTQDIRGLTQRHVLHGVVQWKRKVFHYEADGLRRGVGCNRQYTHNVGVRQQLQRLQLPPQHVVHVVVELLQGSGLALVLDLVHAA